MGRALVSIACVLVAGSPVWGQDADRARRIEELIRQLGSPVEHVRYSAAVDLGKYGPAASPAMPALVKARPAPFRQRFGPAFEFAVLVHQRQHLLPVGGVPIRAGAELGANEEIGAEAYVGHRECQAGRRKGKQGDRTNSILDAAAVRW